MAESDSTTKKRCPKAETPGGRYCPVCFAEVVQEEVKELNRLGECLYTLAHIQELMDEETLEVTLAQLRSWAFLCHHIALWLPEKLHDAAVGQEGGDMVGAKAKEKPEKAEKEAA